MEVSGQPHVPAALPTGSEPTVPLAWLVPRAFQYRNTITRSFNLLPGYGEYAILDSDAGRRSDLRINKGP
jgi:hypothetical protein